MVPSTALAPLVLLLALGADAAPSNDRRSWTGRRQGTRALSARAATTTTRATGDLQTYNAGLGGVFAPPVTVNNGVFYSSNIPYIFLYDALIASCNAQSVACSASSNVNFLDTGKCLTTQLWACTGGAQSASDTYSASAVKAASASAQAYSTSASAFSASQSAQQYSASQQAASAKAYSASQSAQQYSASVQSASAQAYSASVQSASAQAYSASQQAASAQQYSASASAYSYSSSSSAAAARSTSAPVSSTSKPASSSSSSSASSAAPTSSAATGTTTTVQGNLQTFTGAIGGAAPAVTVNSQGLYVSGGLTYPLLFTALQQSCYAQATTCSTASSVSDKSPCWGTQVSSCITAAQTISDSYTSSAVAYSSSVASANFAKATAARTVAGDLQSFTGALGGIAAPAVTGTPFNWYMNGVYFYNLIDALQQSCWTQQTQCLAKVASSGASYELTIPNCQDVQRPACMTTASNIVANYGKSSSVAPSSTSSAAASSTSSAAASSTSSAANTASASAYSQSSLAAYSSSTNAANSQAQQSASAYSQSSLAAYSQSVQNNQAQQSAAAYSQSASAYSQSASAYSQSVQNAQAQQSASAYSQSAAAYSQSTSAAAYSVSAAAYSASVNAQQALQSAAAYSQSVSAAAYSVSAAAYSASVNSQQAQQSASAAAYSASSSAAAAAASASAALTSVPAGWSQASTACIAEGTTGRALTSDFTSGNDMTWAKCTSYCDSKGYPLAGLEYSSECYCGNVLSNGASLNRPSAQCNMAAAGSNGVQAGGGPNAITLFVSNKLDATKYTSDLSDPRRLDPDVFCIIEGTSGRALAAASTTADDMTIGKCIAFCAGKGMQYAGLEYSRECYCGNDLVNGASKDRTAPCNMQCAGAPGTICGGPALLSVYQSANLVYTATNIGDYKKQGCIQEVSGRALNQATTATPDMTLEKCVAFCQQGGYAFAGLEYSSECYCGNTLANGATLSAFSTECKMPCSGNSNEICGGPNAISLYATQAGLSLVGA